MKDDELARVEQKIRKECEIRRYENRSFAPSLKIRMWCRLDSLPLSALLGLIMLFGHRLRRRCRKCLSHPYTECLSVRPVFMCVPYPSVAEAGVPRRAGLVCRRRPCVCRTAARCAASSSTTRRCSSSRPTRWLPSSNGYGTPSPSFKDRLTYHR